MEIVRALMAAYIVATLSATALAKLKNWRLSSAGVTREGIFPSRAAVSVVIATSLAELAVACFVTTGDDPIFVGIAGACLFLAFCGYQLMVAARTNSLMCSCAGTARSDAASSPAVTGAVLACLTQAAVCGGLGFIPSRQGMIFYLFTAAAWLIPVTMLAFGILRRSGQSEMNTRFWLAAGKGPSVAEMGPAAGP
jgi:hypothetical protein